MIFLLPFSLSTTLQKYLCPLREPIKCGNWPPSTVTSTEWKILQTMTQRVRCQTSTGCLIMGAPDCEHLSEKGRKALCCEMSGGEIVASDLVGWLNTEELGSNESVCINMPSQFHSWSVFSTVDAGGHCFVPKTGSLESRESSWMWSVYSQRDKAATWNRNSVVMCHCVTGL